MNKEFSARTTDDSSTNADGNSVSPTCPKPIVSGGVEREQNFYCRNRDCLHHRGISKRDNVICSARNPQIVSDKDGMKRCFSYRR